MSEDPNKLQLGRSQIARTCAGHGDVLMTKRDPSWNGGMLLLSPAQHLSCPEAAILTINAREIHRQDLGRNRNVGSKVRE